MHINPISHRKPKYWIGDIVYLRVCDECRRGMVTGVMIRPEAELFAVTWASANETFHSACELTTEFIPVYCDNPNGSAAAN